MRRNPRIAIDLVRWNSRDARINPADRNRGNMTAIQERSRTKRKTGNESAAQRLD